MSGLIGHKSQVFASIKDVIPDDGTVFGSTVLAEEWEKVDGHFHSKKIQTWRPLTSFVLGLYNRRGIFNNYEDNPELLA